MSVPQNNARIIVGGRGCVNTAADTSPATRQPPKILFGFLIKMLSICSSVIPAFLSAGTTFGVASTIVSIPCAFALSATSMLVLITTSRLLLPDVVSPALAG